MRYCQNFQKLSFFASRRRPNDKNTNAVLYCSKYSSTQAKPYSEIPEPRGLPLLGTILDYTKFRNFDLQFFEEFLRKRHKKLGTIFKEIQPGSGVETVFCSSSHDTESMFRSETPQPYRPPLDMIVESRRNSEIDAGLANVQGNEWHEQRKVFNNHFLTNKSTWSYAKEHLEIAHDVANYISKNLDANNEVQRFDQVLGRWALEGISVVALDHRLGAFSSEIDETTERLINTINVWFAAAAELIFSPPLWKYIETKQMKNFRKLQMEVWDLLKIHRKRIQEAKRKDASTSKLGFALDSSDLSDQKKLTIVLDSIFAGVDTTSNAASFVLYCLAVNPDKQVFLRSEINDLIQSGQEITGKVLQKMKYMHAVNREAQRLFPLTFGTSRKLPKEIILSGYRIPAGTTIMLTSNITNNRDPKYFKDPESFLPERWLTSSREARFVMTGSFGHGPRACPGRKFAMQEVHCLIIALLSRFKVEYHHEPFRSTFNLVAKPLQKPQFSFLPLNQ